MSDSNRSSDNSEQDSQPGQDTEKPNEGRDDTQGNDDQSQQQTGTSTAEKAVMILSTTFTVLLFVYAGWQLATPAVADAPEVSITGTEPVGNGSVAVTVQLQNPSDTGLITAAVESDCSSPPVAVSFSYIPADSTRTGTLVCPAETTEPSVTVVNWVSR